MGDYLLWNEVVDSVFNIIDTKLFACKVIGEVKTLGILSILGEEYFHKAYMANYGTDSWKKVEKLLDEAFPLVCPKEGSFIGYKKAYKVGLKEEGYTDAIHSTLTYRCEDVLITLEIPAEAKRSNAFGRKCRCSQAKVLDILGLSSGEHYESALSKFNQYEYRLGEMAIPDSFDERRWAECSNGIHFFINKEEAIAYQF